MMTDNVDTSAEAARRQHDTTCDVHQIPIPPEALPAMLRQRAEQAERRTQKAEAERDAAQARAARMRKALEKVQRRVQDQFGGRTFDDCSRDLLHADAICRAALAEDGA